MATTTTTTSYRPEIVDDVPGNPFSRISWGGIIAGLALVIALQMLLTLLGVGIGLSTIRPATGEVPDASAIGLGGGLWWVVTNWVALIAGGYVAARLAGSHHTEDGLLHGLVTWAAALVLGGLILAGAVSQAVSATGHAMGGIASGIGNAAGGAMAADGPRGPRDGGPMAEARRMMDQARGLLRPQDPARLSDEAAVAEVAAGLTRVAAGDQSVDQDRLAAVIAAKAEISPEEAKMRLQQWQGELAAAKEKMRMAADQAVLTGRQVAFWGFVVVIVGAVAACVGGCIGTRHHVETRVVTTRTTHTEPRPTTRV